MKICPGHLKENLIYGWCLVEGDTLEIVEPAANDITAACGECASEAEERLASTKPAPTLYQMLNPARFGL